MTTLSGADEIKKYKKLGNLERKVKNTKNKVVNQFLLRQSQSPI